MWRLVLVVCLFQDVLTGEVPANKGNTNHVSQLPQNIKVLARPSESYVLGDSATGVKESGFLVDLLNVISKSTGTSFTIVPRPDLTSARAHDKDSYDGTILGPLTKNEGFDLAWEADINTADELVADFLVPVIPYKLKVIWNPKFGLTNDTQYLIQDADKLTILKSSTNSTVRNMYRSIMTGQPDSIGKGNGAAEGIKKVLSGNFAFIAASPFVYQHLASHVGELAVEPLHVLGFFYVTFATPVGSPLRKPLDIELLKLKEDGTLELLREKYAPSWTKFTARYFKPGQFA